MANLARAPERQPIRYGSAYVRPIRMQEVRRREVHGPIVPLEQPSFWTEIITLGRQAARYEAQDRRPLDRKDMASFAGGFLAGIALAAAVMLGVG